MQHDRLKTVMPAQSDDRYDPIAFLDRTSGRQVRGTVGWREGIENRVTFQVWDGPSAAGEGADLFAAFAAARSGIEKAGFVPLVRGTCSPMPDDPHALFDPAEADDVTPLRADTPRFQPILWWIAAAIVLLGLVYPVLARAEVPEWNRRIPFPNVPYDYRYEGPNYDTRDGSRNSAARMRHEAKERGDPEWRDIPLDPIIAIVKRDSGKVVARYHLEGGQFCAYDEDNCDLDGLFPIIVPEMKDEPVLGVIRHVGAHGQRLSILRPLADRKAPVFEATADFALGLRVRRERLFITLDRAMPCGEVKKEHLQWPSLGEPPTPDLGLPDVTLPTPLPLSPSAAAFEKQLRRIARDGDLDGFMALLADDVLVSFGGDGGKAEFAEHWRLDSEMGRQLLWQTLERLLDDGGWNEAGGKDDDGVDYAQRLTLPWFFAAWPQDADAENVFIAHVGAGLRAAPDRSAPVLTRLGDGGVVYGDVEEGEEALSWIGNGWLAVIAPGGDPGFVAQEDVVPLLETRMIAHETPQGWRIEAMVSGD